MRRTLIGTPDPKPRPTFSITVSSASGPRIANCTTTAACPANQILWGLDYIKGAY